MGQQQQQEQQEQQQQQQQPQPEPLRRGRQPDVASSATEQLAALHSQALADAHAALVMEPPLQTEDGEYCGTGYLLQHEGLLLVLANAHDAQAGWEPNETKEFLVYGLEAGAMRAAACDPQRFTIVARMLGPELLAMKLEARADLMRGCAWSFAFTPTQPGTYAMEAVLILVDGAAPWRGDGACAARNGVGYTVTSESRVLLTLDGGPMYVAAEACCEYCTRRVPTCTHWSATAGAAPMVPILNATTAAAAGDAPRSAVGPLHKCVLYGGPVPEPVALPERYAVVSGVARRESVTPHYVGPSMPFMRERACARAAALVTGSDMATVTVALPKASPAGKRAPGAVPPAAAAPRDASFGSELPLCTRNLLHEGRLVALDDLKCRPRGGGSKQSKLQWPVYEPALYDDNGGGSGSGGGALSPLCYQTDGAAPALLWAPYACRYAALRPAQLRRCAARRGLITFADYGDSLLYMNADDMHAVWSAVTGGTLDNAFPEGISAFTFDPRRLAEHWRASGVPHVFVGNFALMHRLWHHDADAFAAFLDDLAAALDGLQTDLPKEMAHGVRFWLAAPALVSEREPHCSFERALAYSAGLRRVLQPRGWVELPWHNITLARSLSIADGMHHGPELGREMMRLMLHQLCAA